jgi:predicted permease
MTRAYPGDSGRGDRDLRPALDSVWRDLRLALRNARRNPGSTLLALIVLGATIGLNTTLFTLFNSVAMRPWAVRDASDVVSLFRARVNATSGPDAAGGFALEELRYFARHSRTLSGVLAMQNADDLRLGDSDRPVKASYVSGNYFTVLGIDMAKGRGFASDEDRVDGPRPVVVLAHHTWVNQFGGDANLVGKDVRVGTVALRVVGVAAENFAGTNPTRTDLWIPFAAMPLLRPSDASVRAFLREPGECCVSLAGRLAQGVDADRAAAELSVLDRQFSTLHKQTDRKILVTGTSFLAHPGAKRSLIVPAFALLFAGVSVVLLLACANIGSLLLARAAARRREIAVRTALGASRTRLVRLFMTENLLLAFAAGLLGLWIASVLPSYLLNDVFDQGLTFQFRPDTNVFLYTLAVVVAACVAFGLVPSLQATRLEADEVLREHTATSGVRQRARNMLLAIQVMASVVLLVCTALLARGLSQAQTQDPGFAVRGVAVVSFDLPPQAYEGPRLKTFFSTLEQDLAQSPAADSVAFTSSEPFGPRRTQIGCRASETASNSNKVSLTLNVSPKYFDVLRIPLVAGRTFRLGEEPASIIVNQAAAHLYWPGQRAAVGQTLVCGDAVRQVVGVARDAFTFGLDQVEPTVYDPITAQQPPRLLVRTSESDTMAAVTALVSRHDDRVKLRVMPLSGALEQWLAPTRGITGLAAILGAYALILSTAGMFGVFTYVVQQRTSELGIRMALGATPSQVVRGVLASTTRAVAVGVIFGVACAALASQLLTRYLYGVSPLDPVAYGAAVATVAGAALAASYLPARRATRLDPVKTLRCS